MYGFETIPVYVPLETMQYFFQGRTLATMWFMESISLKYMTVNYSKLTEIVIC